MVSNLCIAFCLDSLLCVYSSNGNVSLLWGNYDLNVKTRLLLVAGITMEGDDILLAEMDVKVAPKREEWMTTLPPERKVRVNSIFSSCPSSIYSLWKKLCIEKVTCSWAFIIVLSGSPSGIKSSMFV